MRYCPNSSRGCLCQGFRLCRRFLSCQILYPVVLAVVLEHCRKLDDLVYVDQNINGQYRQFQNERRNQTNGNGDTPHGDAVTDKAEFGIAAGCKDAGDHRHVDRLSDDIVGADHQHHTEIALGGICQSGEQRRGGDRTNSNFCVMGNSGVGKSTAIKHILLSEYMKGTRIIVIDPESEYRDLCQNLNGDWINAVGGSKGMINPLQVRPSPRDDEDEIEELRLYRGEGYGMNEPCNDQLSELAMHMKNLEIFFSLYIPSLTDMQKAVLKKCLVVLFGH